MEDGIREPRQHSWATSEYDRHGAGLLKGMRGRDGSIYAPGCLCPSVEAANRKSF